MIKTGSSLMLLIHSGLPVRSNKSRRYHLSIWADARQRLTTSPQSGPCSPHPANSAPGQYVDLSTPTVNPCTRIISWEIFIIRSTNIKKRLVSQTRRERQRAEKVFLLFDSPCRHGWNRIADMVSLGMGLLFITSCFFGRGELFPFYFVAV